jgi:hypothetical protein
MHAGVLKTGRTKLYVASGDVRSTKMPEIKCLHEKA